MNCHAPLVHFAAPSGRTSCGKFWAEVAGRRDEVVRATEALGYVTCDQCWKMASRFKQPLKN